MINKEYKLKESNHFETTSNKTKIVVGNSYASDMKHFDRWVNRIHGKSKNTTPYSIDLDGVIYEHYDPKYDSLFTNNEIIDRSIIGVTLVNEGYINIDNEKKLKLTWNNDISNISKKNTDDVGFIAQEVEDVIKYAVDEFQDIQTEKMYKKLKHERIIPYLVGAIQKLNDENSKKSCEINRLNDIVINLLNRLECLESK